LDTLGRSLRCFLTARVDARQRVRNRTCLDVDARRRVMHIHEPVIHSAQAQVTMAEEALVEAAKTRRNI